MTKSLPIIKIMTHNVVTVDIDDTLAEVKRIFDQQSFHHLVVVEHGRLHGVVSDRDLLKALSPKVGTPAATVSDMASLNKKVHQVMSRKPVSLPLKATVLDAISVFNTHRVSCIPIVDENQRPAGIVSWRDILRVIEDRLKRRPGPTA